MAEIERCIICGCKLRNSSYSTSIGKTCIKESCIAAAKIKEQNAALKKK